MKGCKNCPDYAKCTVTYRGSACAALRGTYGLDNDPEIITNADRIRAMSDHDLAVFLEHAMYDSSEPDWMTILDWLQQPAKEDEHEISQP